MTQRKPRRNQSARTLRVEPLEARRLLASDMQIFHNVADPEDINGDGVCRIDDAFMVINEVRNQGFGSETRMADVNVDGVVNVVDAFQVVHRIRTGGPSTNSLEVRIERLSNAIENNNLPERVDADLAQQLLLELELQLAHEMHTSQEEPGATQDDGFDQHSSDENPGSSGEDDYTQHSSDENPGSGGEDDYTQHSSDENPGSSGEDDYTQHSSDENPGSSGEGELPLDVQAQVAAGFELLDQNDDGALTVDESPEHLWEQMLLADGNEDESITLDELEELLQNDLTQRIAYAFEQLDQDGDGQLTAEEAINGIWDIIAPFDTSEDGVISLEEFRAAIDDGACVLSHISDQAPLNMYGSTNDLLTVAQDLFNRIDANDDGAIGEGEVPREAWEELRSADGDGDAQVTFDELLEYGEVALLDQLDELFAVLDIDDSGMLTSADVGDLAAFFLQPVDTDNSDSVNVDEWSDLFYQVADELFG